jgi:hypothetical protein
MLPTESDLDRISQTLATNGSGKWKALKSELHAYGKEVLFWFLIDDSHHINHIIDLFRELAADDLLRFDEAEFELSFIEIRDGKKTIWDVVANEEIRDVRRSRKWGESPQHFKLRDDELFSEYI